MKKPLRTLLRSALLGLGATILSGCASTDGYYNQYGNTYYHDPYGGVYSAPGYYHGAPPAYTSHPGYYGNGYYMPHQPYVQPPVHRPTSQQINNRQPVLNPGNGRNQRPPAVNHSSNQPPAGVLIPSPRGNQNLAPRPGTTNLRQPGLAPGYQNLRQPDMNHGN